MAAPDSSLAFILAGFLAGAATACPKYDRDAQYGGWKSWGDCQDTRAKVLIRDSKVEVSFRSGKTCTVDSGSWYDPYSDETFRAAGEVQIEHVIPLSEAHKSGAWAWPRERQREFANFLDSAYHLLPIKGAVNSSKGDRDPALWLPPNREYHARYAGYWVRIKAHWKLKADKRELEALHALAPSGPGLEFPAEAPEDICTDVGPVALRMPERSRFDPRGTGFPWAVDGRLRLSPGR